MTYDSDSHIQTISEVKAFFHHVVFERKADFHPDDDFSQYLSPKKEPLFTPEECVIYNALLAECFTVCDAKDEDIYDLGWDVLEKFLTNE